MSEVVEINRIDELDSLQSVWRSLLAQTRDGSFLQSLDWLKTYWRHFGHGQRLRVLAVSSRGRVIGILPLTVAAEKTRIGGIRVLTYPLHDWGSFYGPIGPCPTTTLTASLRHVRQTPRDWDVLDLRWTDKSGGDCGRTPKAMEEAGLRPREGVWRRLAVVDTRGSWEEYLASRTPGFRKHIRRHLRTASESGRLEHIRYRPLGEAHGDDDPRWDLYDACVEVARRSWQSSSRTGTTLCHAAVSDFLREAHGAAARAGAVDLNLLRLNGRPIAFGYNFHHQGYVLGLRTGYDPEFSHLGPGSALYAHTLRDSCERGDRAFDLGPGSLSIKRGWLTRIAVSYRYIHYPLTSPRGQLVRMKRWLTRAYGLPAGGALTSGKGAGAGAGDSC
jgi:CelD/BcsL family acetyltransferase involved in cellulose biosynthesis